MRFDLWLNNHLEDRFKLPPCRREENSAELIECKNDMTFRIEDIPSSVAVIESERAANWNLWQPNKPYRWARKCDYLLVGQLDEQYFAVFIELKTTYRDDEGKWQLLWSQPLFHHMLSMYNIDCQADLRVSDFIVKFWKICYSLSGNYQEETVLEDDDISAYLKDPMTLSEDEETYFSDCFRGLEIHNRISVPIQLKKLIEI